MLNRHLAFLSILALAGCASEASTSRVLTRDEGGTVVAADAELTVPPSALTEDTSVSLVIDSSSGYPDLPDGLDRVVVLEPAGVVLERAASVTFDADPPEDAVLRVRELVDGEWRPSELASVARDEETSRVRLTVSRFGVYGVTAAVPEVPDAAVTVTVETDGAPAAEVSVTLWTQFEEQIVTVPTDAEGRATFDDIAEGQYFITVAVPEGQCGESFASFSYSPDSPVSVEVSLSTAC